METEPAESSSSNFSFSNLLRDNWVTALAVLIVLVIGTTGGFLVGQSLAPKQSDTSDSSVPKALLQLQNPLFLEWFGSVEGTLVDKDDSSFVLENSGSRLTIKVHEKLTSFGKLDSSGERINLKLADIPLESRLRGSALINKNIDQGEDLVGQGFLVIETPE